MSLTPTESPNVASVLGLKDFRIVELTVDNASTLTYDDTLQLVAGAIEASVTPDNSDPIKQYYDDVEGKVIYADPEIAFRTKMADIPLAIQEKILGNTIDENGVLIRKAGDEPKYFAVGFRSLKSDGKYRYVWLYKVRAKPITETYSTKKGKDVTLQEPEIEWTAIKRTHDNEYQAIADEGENGFDTTAAAAFLSSVYEASYPAPAP